MPTLYYSPGTCALGIHLLLEEVGKPYEVKKIDLPSGQQHSPEFTQINPKAKVPVLVRDDGSVLTEFPAIATWLALTNQDKALLPSEPEAMVRTLEAVSYVTGTLHVLGFTRIWLPKQFTPNEADYPAVRQKGHDIVNKGLELFNQSLENRIYLGGDSLRISDAALFYLEFWIDQRLKQPLPENCARHYRQMRARPAVQRALEMEGLM